MDNLSFKMKVNIGEDEEGKFLEHGLKMADELRTNMTRHYYEEVDRLLLENMPENLLLNLADTVNKEIERRLKERVSNG